MAYISDAQKHTMALVAGLVDEFGTERWFMQLELAGITKHSMDALVNKEYLERKVACGNVYYRRLKTLEAD